MKLTPEQDREMNGGVPGTLINSRIPNIGLVGDLVRRLRLNPFLAEAWIKLGNEFLHRSDWDEAEICFLASMYLFDPIPRDVQRCFFQVYAKRRIRNDMKKSQDQQLRELQTTVNVSLPRSIASVRVSKLRVEQELIVCLNALEVDHGGI